jgi:outer membrane protein assembly factor BamD
MLSNQRWPLLATLFAMALFAGCGGDSALRTASSDPTTQTDPDKLYAAAQYDMRTSNFREAITQYEQLEARFPFSNAAKQAQIDLMYAYYKSRQPESAIDQADQFMRENPTHPRVDYAYYIKGLVYFDRSPNFLERWFKADLTERPPTDARKSFQSFQTLLQRFPDSEYADDSRQRMVFLRNRLADYEVHVAEFYLSRGIYVGAVNRAKFTLENYDGAPAMKRALEVMKSAYTALDLKELAADADKVLKENFAKP